MNPQTWGYHHRRMFTFTDFLFSVMLFMQASGLRNQTFVATFFSFPARERVLRFGSEISILHLSVSTYHSLSPSYLLRSPPTRLLLHHSMLLVPCPPRSTPYLLTLVYDSSSSDGHTDSAFGESIVSSSSVSTPVGGLSSNRFNPTLSTTTSHEVEAENDMVSQQSSSSNLLEGTAVDVQEAREDEEAGYARLEDIRSSKESREKTRYCFRIFACLLAPAFHVHH